MLLNADMPAQRYSLYRRENLRARATMMALGFGFGTTSAAALHTFAAVVWPVALAFGIGSAMAGMMLMFVASALNLRHMRLGIQRLAAGERDRQIPPEWCPVHTAATIAALDLAALQAGPPAEAWRSEPSR